MEIPRRLGDDLHRSTMERAQHRAGQARLAIVGAPTDELDHAVIQAIHE